MTDYAGGSGASDESGTASPIADLTYRTYDGPLHTRTFRWWIVALAGLRSVVKNKGMWVVAGLGVLPYLITTIMLYTLSRAQQAGAGGMFAPAAVGEKYATSFLQAMQWQSLFVFIAALIVGSGCIARDNQANALLVYLSKPLTKADYLLGKWMAVFVAVFAVGFAPAFLLFIYCMLTYASEGFFREEPWLIVRVIGACAVPAAVHASCMVGFSAWSKTGRMAGSFYAGLYYLSGFVSSIFWMVKYRGNMGGGTLERHLSIDGAIDGLIQNVLGVTLRMNAGNRRTQMPEMLVLPPPNVYAMLAIVLGLCVAGVLAARLRIRAVEVVRG